MMIADIYYNATVNGAGGLSILPSGVMERQIGKNSRPVSLSILLIYFGLPELILYLCLENLF